MRGFISALKLYYGLRDYGTATWEGGDAECDHVEKQARNDVSEAELVRRAAQFGTGTQAGSKVTPMQFKDTCGKCGARRIDKQIGLEPTVDAYVAKLVEVFREVRRLLHPTGVVFLNLGDSYNGSGGAGGDYSEGGLKEGQPKYPGRRVNGLKPKDLCMIPARVAIALQDDGWWLRQEIVWHKKSCMPESVLDRCTRAHEMVYMLAKNATYYYDHIAIAEPQEGDGRKRGTHSRQYIDATDKEGYGKGSFFVKPHEDSGTRNKRSVWTLGPESYADAHFATYPTKLVEPCILAGTSAYGACSKCLAPWARVVEREVVNAPYQELEGRRQREKSFGAQNGGVNNVTLKADVRRSTTGWQPTCTCFGHFELIEPEPEYDEDGDETVASQLRPPRRVFVADGELPEPVPCTVLDPFNGSGTTGAVALKHHRRYIGIDLNADYLALSHRRIQQSQPLLFALEVTP